MTAMDHPSEASIKGLLRLLEQAGEQQCRALEDESQKKLARIRRLAFSEARQRVSKAIKEERKRMEQAIARVTADLETTQRQRRLAHHSRLAEHGREGLLTALIQRWQQADQRKSWTLMLLDEAAAVVIGREWRIECPPDWPAEEREWAIQQARARHDAAVELTACADLQAGLRLISGGLSVDASPSGLLANQQDIDAALLQLFAQTGSGETP